MAGQLEDPKTTPEPEVTPDDKAVEETVVEETTTDTDQPAEKTADDLTEEDLEVAKEIYKSLRDPKKSESAIRNLAKTLNIKLEQDASKPSQVTDKDTGKKVSIKELVDSKLPPAWKAMGPMMAEILEAYQSEFVEKQFTKTQLNQHEERSVNAIEYGRTTYEDFSAYESTLEELSRELPPGKLDTQKDYNRYIDNLYTIAKARSGGNGNVNDKLAKLFGKTVKNAKRATPGPSDVNRVKVDNTAKTPMEAIKQAMAELNMK